MASRSDKHNDGDTTTRGKPSRATEPKYAIRLGQEKDAASGSVQGLRLAVLSPGDLLTVMVTSLRGVAAPVMPLTFFTGTAKKVVSRGLGVVVGSP